LIAASQCLLVQSRRVIISPASGIHRPSYNGAPAKQTCLAMNVRNSSNFGWCNLMRGNVCGATANTAHHALRIKPLLS
jgi:hypothetical protein